MKNGWKTIILITAVAVVVGAFLLYKNKPSSHFSPPLPQAKCGVQECHGVNLTCGPNVVEMCTDLYAMGDGCRQYFKCGYINNGACDQIPDERYEKCRACVKKCISNTNDGPEKAMTCDSNCVKNTP